MSRESICSISTFPAASDGSDMDNVVLSGTKGGRGLKRRQETPSKRREEEQNQENGQV